VFGLTADPAPTVPLALGRLLEFSGVWLALGMAVPLCAAVPLELGIGVVCAVAEPIASAITAAVVKSVFIIVFSLA
jgi:hypothetical protein